MSWGEKDWLSLTEASGRLGVHPTTLRRWADSGDIPHFRTPGGHRRFRATDLAAWMQGKQTTGLAPQSEALVQSAVGFTRQEMAQQHVSGEPWYAAFQQEEERQQMRDTGRQLFGLAIQYMSRRRNHELVLQEGRRIGEFYGQQSAQHGVSLVDTVRALFFFRESLLRAAKPGQVSPGQYDAEDVRIHRQLRHFLDEVMYACLASYEAACQHLLGAGSAL
ncbi:MAG: helix-turn-helix domain-containing protein [Anaerolineae bacterium]|jgi:excisionase family DNA binding protein